MKKILLLFIAVITMTSCQITEEITFNEDGSGTYDLAIDMSAMMSMKKAKKKNSENEEIRKPKKTDSIMYVRDLLKKYKDSLKNLSDSEKDFMERMKNATIRMQVDEEADKMIMNLSSPFKSVEDLKNISEDFRKIDKLKKAENSTEDENPMGKMFNGMDKANVSYTFSKHKFSRKVTFIENKEEKKADEEAEKTDNKIDKGMADMMKMFGYKIIYHFPRKIKNVSYKDAMLGTDGKTLIIQTTFDKIDKNKKLLEFDVTF